MPRYARRIAVSLATRSLVGLGLVLVGVLACEKQAPREVQNRAPDQAQAERPQLRVPLVERVILRVEASGMRPVEVAATIVQPIEDALAGLPGLRHLTAEAVKGEARVVLELDPDRYTEATDQIRARMQALNFAPGIEAPRPYELPRPEAHVRYALHDKSLDLGVLVRVHHELVERGRAVPGVVAVESCAPVLHASVELDPARVQRFGLDPLAVEAALRGHFDRPSPPSLGELRTMTLGDAHEGLNLAHVAAYRVGFGEPTCVAAGASGIAASASFELAGPEIEATLAAALDDFAASLGPGLSLHAFRPADASLTVSIENLGPEAGAERVGALFGAEAPPWLIEVGVEREPCVGSGLTGRLSLRGYGKAEAQVAESVRAEPEVARVEADQGGLRLWVFAASPEDAGRRALEVGETLATIPALASLSLYTDPAEPSVVVEPNLERLEAVGIRPRALAQQVQLVREGVLLGEVVNAAGTRIPITLSVVPEGESRPDRAPVVLEHLRTLMVYDADRAVPLAELADLRLVAEPVRICRRDGRVGIMALARATPEHGELALARAIEAALGDAGEWAKTWE